MKRILTLLVLSMALGACGGKPQDKGKTAETPKPAPAAAEQQAASPATPPIEKPAEPAAPVMKPSPEAVLPPAGEDDDPDIAAEKAEDAEIEAEEAAAKPAAPGR